MATNDDQTSFLNIPFWCGCICFLIGITCSYQSWISLKLETWNLAFFVICFLLVLVFLWKYPPKNNFFLSICIGFTFIILGTLRTEVSKKIDRHKKDVITNSLENKEVQKVFFQIKKIQNSNQKFHNYIAQSYSIADKIIKTDFILKVKPSKNRTHLVRGAWYSGWLELQEIPKKNFSYGFNYTKYLNNQHIYHQCFISANELIKITPTISSIKYPYSYFKELIYKLHQKTNESIESLSMDKNVEAITKALVLGDRSEISKKTITNFKDAGIIHILAISGLHIGIVFGFWQYLFTRITPKNNKSIKVIGTLLFLWMSIFFLGNSPSTLRAGIMCTLFFLSKYQRNRQHPLNIICTSVFLLMLYDPFLLFNVGFQLSIIAILGICIGLPLWNSIFKIKNQYLKILSSGIGVSITAQLSLLPLSLYYFNQFSGLFILANVPILFIISGVFLLGCLLSFGGILISPPNILIQVYEFTIKSILHFAEWLSTFKEWIWKEIFLDSLQVTTLYLLLFTGIYLYLTQKKLKYSFAIIFMLSLASFKGLNAFKNFSNDELWLINTKSTTALINSNKDHINVFTNNTSSSKRFIQERYLSSLEKKQPNKVVSWQDLQEYYLLNQTPICFIDSQFSKLNHKDYCKNAILIFKEKTQVNLYEIIKQQQPKVIISLKGNYPDSRKKWSIDCKKLGIPYHEFKANSALELVHLLNNSN